MNKIRYISLIVFAFLSCKTKEPCPVPLTENGIDFTVKLNAVFNGQTLSWSQYYVTASNDSIRFDKIKFLISEITLETSDGILKTLDDTYAYLSLKDGRDSFILKNVPKGTYKSFRFKVGLDTVVNHSNPAQWALDHPLSPSLNEMHWSWAGGYIFNVIEGYYKDNGNVSGFSFHVALERNARVHSFIQTFDAQKNVKMTFDLHADKYFSNVINFSLINDGAFSHSGTTDPIMDKFILNMNGIFELKSIE